MRETGSVNEAQSALLDKITGLFYICDTGQKGYVTREDLYRLKDELGLDDDEVENAFDQLDTDTDNFLTLDEFTTGFGLFLGVEQPQYKMSVSSAEIQPDFAFQVFNLIDKEDKGHITKDDLYQSANTLEINPTLIDDVYQRLRVNSEIIHFEDFVQNISVVVAVSPPLQEIQTVQEEKEKNEENKEIIARVFRMDLTDYNEEDIEKLLQEQATNLFQQCDSENKKYITKQDLVRLSDELALSKQQVNEAFTRLDVHNNHYLTLLEFINGFGLFLGIEKKEEKEDNYDSILDEKYTKAGELFDLCDVDKKGYVTKRDLSLLTTEHGLTKEQISEIFKHLDEDNDGFITLYEFIHGFSSFMVDVDDINHNNENDINHNNENDINHNNENDIETDNGFDEKYFTDSSQTKMTLERSGSGMSSSSSARKQFISRQMSMRYESGVFDVDEVIENMDEEIGSSVSKDQLTELWNSVSNSGDHMTTKMFEDFLTKVFSEIKTAKQETKHLEDVLERKAITHTEEIKRIYDEMEVQMLTEKNKQKELDARRESMIRDDLMKEMKEKEKHIAKFMQRQTALEKRLEEIKEQEQLLKFQNSKLAKENFLLEDKLNDSMSNLDVLRSNLNHLEQQTTQEKKETLKAAVQATQGIHYEHDNLVRQLDMLKDMNQKLRDDRDTIEASLNSKVIRLPRLGDELETTGRQKPKRHDSNLGHYVQPRTTSTPSHSPLKKQGSILSNYFAPQGDHVHSDVLEDSDSPKLHTKNEKHKHLDAIGETEEECLARRKSRLLEESELSEKLFNASLEMDPLQTSEVINSAQTSSNSITPSSPRRAPVGRNTEDTDSFKDKLSPAPSFSLQPENPSRVYKVVFVGDSSVGKSSFIYRFCFDDFRPNFSATIGVDFQVKTIKLNRQWVALQLWDTAGQERFRSITKQYFRRADGVVIMFDLSSEPSFINVKRWMLSVEEGVEPDCCVMILGNKIDLVESDESLRKVKHESAVKLAEEYNAMYYEVSARSDIRVSDSIHTLAKKMEANEDSLLKHSVLNLSMKDESLIKKKCCSR